MKAYMSDHCRLSCKQCTAKGPRPSGPNDKLLTVEELSRDIGKTAARPAPAAVASPSPSPRYVLRSAVGDRVVRPLLHVRHVSA
jgi:hypothetical protein